MRVGAGGSKRESGGRNPSSSSTQGLDLGKEIKVHIYTKDGNTSFIMIIELTVLLRRAARQSHG